MHTTVALKPLGDAELKRHGFETPLWTSVASFVRRMYAGTQRAGYLGPVRVRIMIRLGDEQCPADPYEDPEFV